MQIINFAILFSAAIFSIPNVFSAPVQIKGSDVLITRNVTPNYSFDPHGDLHVSPRTDTKKARKQAAKQQRQKVVHGHVDRFLQSAQSTLNLPHNVPVNLKNDFHTSNSELQSHVTFEIHHPPLCGGKPCVGHVFDGGKLSSPGKGHLGQIFDGHGTTIFGGHDVHHTH